MRLVATIAFLFLILHFDPASACTVFKSPLPNDSSIAHGVGWYRQLPAKGILVMNPSGMKKSSQLFGAPAGAAPAHWVSSWKSVTFSIIGAEFPTSGFNEKGLSMAVLELPESQYPAAKDPRLALDAGQFVQYSLDTAFSLDEVIASDKTLKLFSDYPLHYFVCDRSSNCAVLQFISGRLNVYRGGTLPYAVLTNSLYPDSVQAAQKCTASACQQTDESLWRFAQAARLDGVLNPSGSFADQAKNILNKVVQSSDEVVTIFQMVYDSKNLDFQIRQATAPKYTDFKIKFSNLKCRLDRPTIFIEQDAAGNLKTSWHGLTKKIQAEVLAGSGLTPNKVAAYTAYPFSSVSCR